MRFFMTFLLYLIPLFAAADTVRDDNWRQDLDFLASQLPLRHPNLFFQIPKADFDRAVNDLRTGIPTLSDAEVEVRLAAIAALPGDGHTNIFLTQINSTFRLLPIRFLCEPKSHTSRSLFTCYRSGSIRFQPGF
jgi:hypothetical protein